jgi:hypothetical protein
MKRLVLLSAILSTSLLCPAEVCLHRHKPDTSGIGDCQKRLKVS